jgi:hypothetical protein
LILVTFSLARQSKKQPPSDRQPLERPHDLSKTKFNGVGDPRIHIGFMRIRDLYARCAFPGDGDFDATRKQNSTG